jgi:hypothetical protein
VIETVVNPWQFLPESSPYVLDEDRLAVEVFNRFAPETARLHTETCPEPFFGPFDAPIVLLLLNPGVDAGGIYDDELHAVVRASGSSDPHFYIRKRHAWWWRLVRALSSERPNMDISRCVLSVEFIAYRSTSFACGHLRLPSQPFSFALVRQAIERKAALVIVRGARHWIGAVPELHGYENRIGIVNPRRASLSRANLAADGFERLLAALDRS